MASKIKRRVCVRVNPGEPLNGSGKVCIHLFVQDERGPFVEPHVLHSEIIEDGETVKKQLEAKPTRGRLACDPKRRVAPVTKGGVTIVTPRTDDPRAVTCLKCAATTEYAEMMESMTPQQIES
mgnify:CR=1 FL=1